MVVAKGLPNQSHPCAVPFHVPQDTAVSWDSMPASGLTQALLGLGVNPESHPQLGQSQQDPLSLK